MRAIRALQTFTIAIALCVASADFVAVASAESACHSYNKHHDDDDSDTNYNRPHIHAKPQPYVRPYSSSEGIRGDFDPFDSYQSHRRGEDDSYEEIRSSGDPDYYDQYDDE